MNLPIVIRPEAEDDLLAARDWYDQQRFGLGDDFSAEVAVNIERLSAMPRLGEVVWEDVRASRLRRFPYVVYYLTLSDRVEVLAVLPEDATRRPGNLDPDRSRRSQHFSSTVAAECSKLPLSSYYVITVQSSKIRAGSEC